MTVRVRVLSLLVACATLAFGVSVSRAQEKGELPGSNAVPPPVEIPKVLTLDAALKIVKTQSLDLLIANATTMSAEGDVQTAAGIANPNAAVQLGPAFNYNARAPGCSGCLPYYLQVGFSDNAAVVDSLVGKRDLTNKGRHGQRSPRRGSGAWMPNETSWPSSSSNTCKWCWRRQTSTFGPRPRPR